MFELNVSIATGGFVTRIVAVNNCEQTCFYANDMGCLDAPEFLPAGSSADNNGHVAITHIQRA